MGRPKLWEDDAARMRAYRLRKLEEGCRAKGGPRGRRGGQHKRAPWPGPCVYIDGEAYEDGSYAILQTFDPRDGAIHTTETRAGRLTSHQCLQHLFSYPKALIFGYGLRYDISNWLADVPRDLMQQLKDRGYVRWLEYKLDWIPGKVLKVSDRTRPKGDKQRAVYDLHPFFQQPFLTALEAANFDVPDIIRLGKRLRGRFARDNREFVTAYNEAELRAMDDLHCSLCRTLAAGDLKIRSWFGPGSCARLKAEQQGVTVHGIEVYRREDGKRERRAIGELAAFLAARQDLTQAGLEPAELLMHRAQSPHACVVDAFYGGRFELSAQGPIEECWEYDLSSAYPWALASGMPCFACEGEWLPDDSSPWAVGLVSWQPHGLYTTNPPSSPTKPSQPMWGPLPMRMTRNLAWTREGIGWYHRCEIEAAIKHLSNQYSFTVHNWWSWHPHCTHDPWAWVGDAAAERVAVKHSDPAKAQCLKLALNSLYGITADKAGVDKGRVPRYHNPMWAGLITARTRARLLEASAVGGEDIVYLATDGVHSKRPLDLPLGTGLGDWEPPARSGLPAVFLAPGTYLYADGKRGKSRGVNLGKFSDDIRTWRRLYRMTAPRGEIKLLERHFCPFVEALSRTEKQPPRYEEILNTWHTRGRVLSYNLFPRREQREDGRWVAPSGASWKVFAPLILVPSDALMRREEEIAAYQPEWAEHPINGCG